MEKFRKFRKYAFLEVREAEHPEASKILHTLAKSMETCNFWKFSWILREFCINKANFDNN